MSPTPPPKVPSLGCAVSALIVITAAIAALVTTLLCLFVFPRTVHAAPVRGTFAYDYRNNPVVADLRDRELVVLSARGMLAPGRADSLIAAGSRPYVIVQPNQAFTGGVPIGSRLGDDRTFPWDTATYRLALEHDALMRDSTGAWLDMFAGAGGGTWSSVVLDFRNRAFGKAYAALLVATFPKAAGVVLDYGCPWIPITLPGWADWRAGWVAYLDEVRRLRPELVLISQCDQWKTDLPVAGVLLERVGAALNPPAKSFATARALAGAGKRAHLRQEWASSTTRRYFASLAVMFDGTFDQCGDPNRVPPVHVRDLEHFTLVAGVPAGDPWERSPGVWQRMLTRGLVIVNVSGPPFVYRYNTTTTFTVNAGDALLLQNRDSRGRFMKAATNAGR